MLRSYSYKRYIKRGAPDAGFPLFESECLKWPGFVEFDDVNGKVLTYSAYKKYVEVTLCFSTFSHPSYYFLCYLLELIRCMT